MNYEQMNNNKLQLIGTVIKEPVYTHEVFGEGFYETVVDRKSTRLNSSH